MPDTHSESDHATSAATDQIQQTTKQLLQAIEQIPKEIQASEKRTIAWAEKEKEKEKKWQKKQNLLLFLYLLIFLCLYDYIILFCRRL